jgi:18S rRNA (guanine1575-N7)-methyltransferase
VGFEKKRDRQFKKHRGKKDLSTREWVTNKKERQRAQGKEVFADSKYTARKRRPKF